MNKGITILTTFDGQMLMVEPIINPALDRRAFRRVGSAYEWAHLADVEANGARARFYGWASKELPESMTWN
jgi:hypothetical protein